MVRSVDGGNTAPIPQGDSSVEKQDAVKSSTPQQTQQQDSVETQKGAQSNATARAAESSITSKLLATQLQAQIVPEKPVAVVGSAAENKPLLIKDHPNNPADVKNMQKQVNEFRARNGLEPLKEDGIFGPKTKAAVEQFQEANGLKKDGIIGPNTRDRLALENNENFQKLNPDSQNEIRDQMNNSQKDAVTRQNLLLIGTDENFGKLPAAEQKTKLQDVNGTASNIAEKKMQGLNNEKLLKLAESPGGKEQLESLKIALKSGPQTPATLKELDRINSATFTPAGGIKFSKETKPEAQAAYLHMVRRDMLASPSFAKTMNEINADKANPVTVNVGRDMPRVSLDRDGGRGVQDIDLNDIEKLPATPPSGNPHAITQGEVMIHAMKEASGRAKDRASTAPEPDQHRKAHTEAIKAENEFRKDLGQTTFRKLPPDDETVKEDGAGNVSLIIHFDGAPDEEFVFDKQQKLKR